MNLAKFIGGVPSALIMELSEIGKARFGIALATEKRTDCEIQFHITAARALYDGNFFT
jgi:hypothetical protein